LTESKKFLELGFATLGVVDDSEIRIFGISNLDYHHYDGSIEIKYTFLISVT